MSINKFDNNDKLAEDIMSTRASTSGKLDPSDSFAQTSYVRWTTNQYTDCCILASMRVYHTIPESGEGTEGDNYDQTDYGYDSRKRRIREQTPGGTITRQVLDPRSLVLEIYVGTNDTGATPSDPTGGASGNNMVLVTANEYDDGSDGGNGYVTETTQHVNASTTRVTSFTNDFRGRRTAIDGEEDFYEKIFHDNLNRVIKRDRHDTTASGNLVARDETKFDARDRVYRKIRWGVDPSTGTVGESLTDNIWFDDAGNVIKNQPAGSKLFTKSVFDGLNRRTAQYRGFDVDESDYNEVDDLDGDTILEQTETDYDAASNIILVTLRQRYHNATGTGPLGGPNTTQPKARVTYVANWQDAIGRIVASANYGTNGGTALTRPDTIPERSDDVLVDSTKYDDAGAIEWQISPAGIKMCLVPDDAGRETSRILNCIESTSSSSSSSSSTSGLPESDDVNVTIERTYNADGNVNTVTAKNPITGDQTTQFVYGTTLNDSDIASTLLLRKKIYPDSVNDDDAIFMKYNRQNEIKEKKDQNGTVHVIDRDGLGREIHDRATVLGSGVDGGVRRISTEYEVRGMIEKLTGATGRPLP